MKRLIVGGLSVILLMSAAAPTFAAGTTNESNTEACQSIPPAQPSGGATRERLEAIQGCELEVLLKQQQAIMAEMKAIESQMQVMELQMQTMQKSPKSH